MARECSNEGDVQKAIACTGPRRDPHGAATGIFRVARDDQKEGALVWLAIDIDRHAGCAKTKQGQEGGKIINKSGKQL